MGNTTGTTGAGKRAYSSREIYDHFGGDNANTSDMSSADLMAWQSAQRGLSAPPVATQAAPATTYVPQNTNSPAQAANPYRTSTTAPTMAAAPSAGGNPYYGGNANTADMSSAALAAYESSLRPSLAKSGAPMQSGVSVAPAQTMAASGSDRTGLGAMNAQYAAGTAPAAPPAAQANDPLAYLSAFKQAPNTGGIDPYSGTSQSLADMSSADLMKYYADRSATAAANPAGNPAYATAAANGNLNSIPAPNSNVYNPYAGTPATGGATGNAGTNTFQGAAPLSVVTAPPAGSAIAPSSLPATTPASLPATATTPAATLGGLPAGTANSPAGSTFSNPFNNAPNSTVLNPYMMQQAQSIMDMQNRNLQEGAFQQIKDGAMMNGGYGGDRQGIAEGVAMRGADQNIRAQLGSLFGNAYESQAGRDLSRYQGDQGNAVSRFGIQTGANTAASNLQGQQSMANAQLQSGMESNRNNFYTQQRGQDFEQQRLGMQLYGQGQQGTMGGYQGLGGIYDANQNAPWQQLQNYSNLAAPFTGGGSTTAPKPDNTGQYAGAAASLAMMAMMMSDPATKKNVELVGTRPDGLNEYEWEYKKKYQNDPFAGEGRMRGLMTNEVEKVYPQAVVRHPTKDVKMINYGLLGMGA